MTALEVAYKISVSINGSDCDTDLVDNTNIQWNLDKGADAPDDKWGTFAELLTAIDNLVLVATKLRFLRDPFQQKNGAQTDNLPTPYIGVG